MFGVVKIAKSKMILTKQIFVPKEDTDGTRILITRIPPDKMKKHHIDECIPVLGPSEELLAAYKGWSGNPISWDEYVIRFLDEMKTSECIKALAGLARRSAAGEVITLLCYEKESNPHCHRHIVKKLID